MKTCLFLKNIYINIYIFFADVGAEATTTPVRAKIPSPFPHPLSSSPTFPPEGGWERVGEREG